MSTITVTCSRCKGTGVVAMNGVHQQTLNFITDNPQLELSVTDWAKLMPGNCKVTAMAMRLSRLEEMGYLTSRTYGKSRMYAARPTATHIEGMGE